MKSFCRLLPIPYLLLLVLASVSPLHADGEAVLFTDEVQLKIADAFMEEGEYYRAVTEYHARDIVLCHAEEAVP